jgi:hypothetical protein
MELQVSEMTVRRYLDHLEAASSSCAAPTAARSPPRRSPRSTIGCARRCGARRKRPSAAPRGGIVQPGESIFIDAGSTNAFLAMAMATVRYETGHGGHQLHDRAADPRDQRRTSRPSSSAERCIRCRPTPLVGPIAEETVQAIPLLQGLHWDAEGISLQEGCTQRNIYEVPVKRLGRRQRASGHRPRRQHEDQQGCARAFPAARPGPPGHYGPRASRRSTAPPWSRSGVRVLIADSD